MPDTKLRIQLRTSPHLKQTVTVEQIMRNVVYALLPICAFAVYQFGLSALLLLITVTASCLLFERLFNSLQGAPSSLGDWSATITGLLLALTLPPGFPLWMGMVAALAAIGGIERFVKRGDDVIVKPNICHDDDAYSKAPISMTPREIRGFPSKSDSIGAIGVSVS